MCNISQHAQHPLKRSHDEDDQRCDAMHCRDGTSAPTLPPVAAAPKPTVHVAAWVSRGPGRPSQVPLLAESERHIPAVPRTVRTAQ